MGDKQLNKDPNKGPNRYRFQSFAERLAAVKINVKHRVGAVVVEPEESDSFFRESLMKWRELNCTQHFVSFVVEVNPFVESFHLLVHNQKKVVDAILRHLQVPNSLASEPLLDLLTQLARDLRLDFYPYFPAVFKVLVGLLTDLQNVELITNTFTALSYMFKFLSKYLVRDLDEVFSYYLGLLDDDQKPHMRAFAAESFAFLLRKVGVGAFGAHLDAMLSHLHTHPKPGFADGVGALLFETLKGPQHQFHSKAPEVYPVITSRLHTPIPPPLKKENQLPNGDAPDQSSNHMDTSSEGGDNLEGDILSEEDMRMRIYSVLVALNTRMAEHTRKEFCVFVWDTLLGQTQRLGEKVEEKQVGLGQTLQLVSLWVSHRKGARICSMSALYTAARTIAAIEKLSLATFSCARDLSVALMHCDTNESLLTAGSRLLGVLLAHPHCTSNPLEVYTLWAGLLDLSVFPQLCLPHVVRHAVSLNFAGADGRIRLVELLGFLLRLLEHIDLRVVASNVITQTYRLQFPAPPTGKTTVAAHILKLFKDSTDPAVLWAAVRCIRWIEADSSAVRKEMEGLIARMKKVASQEGTAGEEARAVIGIAMETAVALPHAANQKAAIMRSLWPTFWDLLFEYSNNTHILGGFAALMEALPEECKDLRATDNMLKVYEATKSNLSSPSHTVRLRTLTILAAFDQLNMTAPIDDSKAHPEPAQPCLIFEIGRDAEMVPATLERYRDMVVLLKRMAGLAAFGRLPKAYDEVVVRYMVGVLYVNFKLVWEPAIEALASEAARNQQQFWTLMHEQLELAAMLTGPNAPPEAPPVEISEESQGLAEAYMAALRPDRERADHRHFYSYLLLTLQKVPTVAERFSRQLLPIFFDFLEKEYQAVQLDKAVLQDLRADTQADDLEPMDVAEEEEEEEDTTDHKERKEKKNKADREKDKEGYGLGRKAIKQKLLDYLRLFGLFSNPRVLYRGEQVHSLHMELLSNTDRDVQKAALKCLLAYKNQALTAHKDTLEGLLEEDKFRDALAKLHTDSIQDEHREALMGVVVRVLYAHMMRRKGASSSRHSQQARRATALGFMAGAKQEDIGAFIDYILTPFNGRDTLEGWSYGTSVDLEHVVPLSRQLGYLQLLPDLTKQLRFLLLPHVDRLLAVAVRLTSDAVWLLETHRTSIHVRFVGALRSVRLQGMRALCVLFTILPTMDYGPVMPKLVEGIVTPRVHRLANESLQHASGLLEMFGVWSKQRELAPALVTYNNDILPNVYACLSATGVGVGVVAKVHDIVEALLQLKEEEEKEGSEIPASQRVGETVVAPHIPSLLKQMHTSLFAKGAAAAEGRGFNQRELSILSRISGYATSKEDADRLLSLLMPYLRTGSKKINDDTRVHMLGIVRNCLRLVPLTPTHHTFLSQLFASLTTREARLALVGVFEEMGENDPTLAPAVTLLRDLHAYDSTSIEDMDYDTRLAAYARLNETQVHTLSVACLLPIMHSHLYVLSNSDDLSLRTAASHGMLQIGRRAKADLEAGKNETYDELIVRVTIPAMKKAMKSNKEFARHEFLSLINSYVKLFPASVLGELSCLCEEDDETNFFVNVRHIQMHRRIRALTRLVGHAKAGRLTQASIVNFLLPLTGHFIFENTKASEHHLVQEAVSAIGAMCECLSWGHYIRTLRNFLRMVASKPKLEKPLLKAVVAVVHGFHFDVQKIEAPDTQENEDEVEDEGETTASAAPAMSVRISDTLLQSVIPEMYKHLTKKDSDKHESLRPPVALAIVRLLQALPLELLHLELPKLITKVVAVLKSRDDETRGEARETLFKMVDLLGPSYLHFVLTEMKEALNKGYQLHILGYTVHALLQHAIQNGMQPGDVDGCIGLVLDLLMGDLFGIVAEEKEVVAITGKMLEARAKKGPEAYELLAKSISFKHVYNILMPLKKVMEGTEDAKIVRKLEDIFKHIVLGLVANPTADVASVLRVVHDLIGENSRMSQQATKEIVRKTRREETYTVQARSLREKKPASYYLQAHAHMFVELGLALLQSNLKRGRIEGSNPTHLAMVDPLVAMLGDALKSKYDKVVMSALRCLSFCFRFKLPSLEKAVPHLAVRCFKLLNRGGIGAMASEMHQASFRLLTTVVRDYPSYRIPEDHLRHLLSLTKTDLEAVDRQAGTFAMLKAVVGRKVVVGEMYDVMQRVGEVAVRSPSASTRTQCVQLFTQYLLDYPLGEKLLKRHLEFIVKNLDYEHQSGRESALELVRQVVQSFPWDALAEHVQFFFVPLVMVLVNDEAPQCREMAGFVIKGLIQRSNPHHQDKLWELTVAWVSAENLALKRAALQITGLCVEVLGAQFERHTVTCVPLMCAAITDTSLDQDTEEGADGDNLIGQWPILYYSLTTLRKLITVLPSVLSDTHPQCRPLESLFAPIHTHLLHPHSWVRLAAARALGLYCGACSVDAITNTLTGKAAPTSGKKKNTTAQPFGAAYLTSDDHIFALAKASCRQLESKFLAPALGTQVVKNLFFLSKLLQATDAKAEPKINGSSNKRERKEDEEGEKEEEEGDVKEGEGDKQGTQLAWVVRKLAYVARTGHDDTQLQAARRKAIFEYFAALASHLGAGIAPHLTTIISPLYRVTEDTDTDSLTAEERSVHEFARELLELLQSLVGPTAYVAALTAVRQHVQSLRQDRKKRRAFEAVVAPEKRQARRDKANKKKNAATKRKIGSYRPGSAKRAKVGKKPA